MPSNFQFHPVERLLNAHSWDSLWFPSELVHLEIFSVRLISHDARAVPDPVKVLG